MREDRVDACDCSDETKKDSLDHGRLAMSSADGGIPIAISRSLTDDLFSQLSDEQQEKPDRKRPVHRFAATPLAPLVSHRCLIHSFIHSLTSHRGRFASNICRPMTDLCILLFCSHGILLCLHVILSFFYPKLFLVFFP